MWGMQKTILMIVAVALGQSVLAANKKPLNKEESAKVIEVAIRKSLKKPTGQLTKAELEKVKALGLNGTQITDAGLKEVAKMKQLADLSLAGSN